MTSTTSMASMATTTSMASMSAAMSSAMTFTTNNLATMLFSMSWAPTTTGQYAGTWIFIFILAIIWRALVLVQRRLDQHWIQKYSSPSHKEILREIPGVAHDGSVQAWRLSVNLPRAAMAYVVQSIAYLLMLVIMTMNVGFFFAVTTGYFVGELAFGRLGLKKYRAF